ncbi:type II toxin-antitoxin system RelE/ParE family toxin [Methyloversatilis thermotolerans]|nr:type II toxin-antitoxin system RelE/ParE family toxin [Methyloversatilis thermotolerans]
MNAPFSRPLTTAVRQPLRARRTQAGERGRNTPGAPCVRSRRKVGSVRPAGARLQQADRRSLLPGPFAAPSQHSADHAGTGQQRGPVRGLGDGRTDVDIVDLYAVDAAHLEHEKNQRVQIELYARNTRRVLCLDRALAERALDAIRNAFRSLEFMSFSFSQGNTRKSIRPRDRHPFGASGHVALYEIENEETVTTLAARHQREDDDC